MAALDSQGSTIIGWISCHRRFHESVLKTILGISEDQRARIARAYRDAGAEAVEGYRTVLRNLINERDRRRFEPGEAVLPLASKRSG